MLRRTTAGSGKRLSSKRVEIMLNIFVQGSPTKYVGVWRGNTASKAVGKVLRYIFCNPGSRPCTLFPMQQYSGRKITHQIQSCHGEYILQFRCVAIAISRSTRSIDDSKKGE